MAIYYLDIDDEITAAASRIRDSGETRIALVIQGGSRIATSRINFRLLAREAQHHGRKLAIVAADPSVRSLALTAELPVYTSVAEYQRAEGAAVGRPIGPMDYESVEVPLAAVAMRPELPATSRSAGRSQPPAGARNTGSASPAPVVVRPPRSFRPRLSRWVALAAVAVLGVSGLGGYMLWPSATIVLTVRADQIGPTNLTLKVDPAAKTASDASMIVPGVTRKFEVKANGSFSSTGENVVDTAASGTVTFYSGNTGAAVAIAKGTQVETASRIAFATTQATTVPKASLSGTSVTFGSVDVPVVAVKKGESGNVAAGAIVNVPPSLATKLILADGQVTNKQATSGGTHAVTQFVQQSDIDAASAQLQEELVRQLKTKASQSASTADDVRIFADSAVLGELSFDPAPGSLLQSEAKSFDLTVTASGSATGVSQGSAEALVARAMKGAVKKGYSIVDGSVKVAMGAAASSGSVVSVPVTATAMESPSIDVNEVKAAIKGMSADRAEAYLSKYGEARVSLDPFWATTVSGFDFRVDIEIVAPGPSPTAGPSGSKATPKKSAPTSTPTSPPSPTAGPTPTPEPTPTPPPTDPPATPTPEPSPSPSASGPAPT